MKRYIRSAIVNLDDEDIPTQHEIAKTTNRATVLSQLARHEEWYVRQEVASNPSTSASVLAVLADDYDSSVRNSVARNPNTPADILRKLSEDSSGSVRANIGSNPNTPADILVKLSTDVDPCDDYIVRFAVAFNKNTPVATLHEMLNDTSKYVRERACKTLAELGY